MVRPPTAAGIGTSFQNDEVPKTFLKFETISHESLFSSRLPYFGQHARNGVARRLISEN